MRLICPNCSAQYEVDAGLIPAEGREVQCSDCGTGWFQQPASPAGRALTHDDEAGFAYQADDADDADEIDDPDDGLLPPPGPLPRRAAPSGLRDDVRSILMEEAARETRARRGLPADAAADRQPPAADEPGWPPASQPRRAAPAAADRGTDHHAEHRADDVAGDRADDASDRTGPAAPAGDWLSAAGARAGQDWEAQERKSADRSPAPRAGAPDNLWADDEDLDDAQDDYLPDDAGETGPEADDRSSTWRRSQANPGAHTRQPDARHPQAHHPDAGHLQANRSEVSASDVSQSATGSSELVPSDAEWADTAWPDTDWPAGAPGATPDDGSTDAAAGGRSGAMPGDDPDATETWPDGAFPAGPAGYAPASVPGDLLAEASAASGPVPDNRTWRDSAGASGLAALASAKQAGPDAPYRQPAGEPAGTAKADPAPAPSATTAAAYAAAGPAPAAGRSGTVPPAAASGGAAHGADGPGLRSAATPQLRSRRDLLPDIEEINSALHPAHDDTLTEEAGEEERRSSGFSSGFLTVIVLAVLAALVYALSGPLSRSIPALAPALEAYTQQVDNLRIWLDETVRGWITTSR